MVWCNSEECCGTDCDVVFAYKTPKVVAIRDRRLGLFKYTLLLAIFIYVVIFQVVRNGGYTKDADPIATIRMNLQAPVSPAGCKPYSNKYPCYNAIPNVTELSYCSQNTKSKRAFKKFDCLIWDAPNAVIESDRAVMLTTRLGIVNETNNCPQETAAEVAALTSCPQLYTLSDEEIYFIAGVEDFTLLIDHSVQAPEVGVHGSATDITGLLYVAQNDDLCASDPSAQSNPQTDSPDLTNTAPCYVRPNTTSDNLDYFTMGVLLQACNAELDALSGNGHSQRYNGFSIILNIEYNNFEKWTGLTDVSYVYTPFALPKSKYKYPSVTYSQDHIGGANRVYWDRHGIKISATGTGVLKGFDFTTLILQFTTILTFLAVATFTVDSVSSYLMPNKELYRNAKFDHTKDFSEIRDTVATYALELDERGLNPDEKKEALATVYNDIDPIDRPPGHLLESRVGQRPQDPLLSTQRG